VGFDLLTPKRSAILTRSAKERACIFRMMLPRCIFTVTSLISSSAAICLFKSPAVTSPTTSFSRAVSEANWCRSAARCFFPLGVSPDVLFAPSKASAQVSIYRPWIFEKQLTRSS
jgi:hypothetical protein